MWPKIIEVVKTYIELYIYIYIYIYILTKFGGFLSLEIQQQDIDFKIIEDALHLVEYCIIQAFL